MNRLISNHEDRFLLAPYSYPEFVNLKDDMHANHWRPHEQGIGRDLADLTLLTEEQLHIFKSTFSFLTFMDLNIEEPLAYLQLISTAPEVTAFISKQIGEEQNHQDTYQYIAEQLKLDERELYSMYKTNRAMAAKASLASFYTKKIRDYFLGREPVSELVKGVIAYSQGYEGMWFIGGFTPIFALSELGLMRATSVQLKYIWRDELNHLKGWSLWLKRLLKEEGVTLTQRDFCDIIHDFIIAEENFARDEIPPTLGFSAEHQIQHMKALANLRCKAFGFEPMYDANPLEWVGRYQMKNETNFFEGRVIEYRSGGALDGTWE